MSLPVIWPVIRPKQPEMFWRCGECEHRPPFTYAPTFTSEGELEEHRRLEHGKVFEGNRNEEMATRIKFLQLVEWVTGFVDEDDIDVPIDAERREE